MPTIEIISAALVGIVPGLLMVLGILTLVVVVSRSLLGDPGTKGPPQSRSATASTRPPTESAPPRRATPEALQRPESFRTAAVSRPILGEPQGTLMAGVQFGVPHVASPPVAPAADPSAEPGRPVLRACTSCLAVIENATGDTCTVCGGMLAKERTIGVPGQTRNPMRPYTEGAGEWVGHRLDDVNGSRVGIIDEVVIDPETDVIWFVVNISRFSEGRTLVPASGSMISNDHVLVRYTREHIRSGPRGLTSDAYQWGPYRSRLYRYYRPAGRRRVRTLRTDEEAMADPMSVSPGAVPAAPPAARFPSSAD